MTPSDEYKRQKLGSAVATLLRYLKETTAENDRLKAERQNCPPASESEYVRRLEADVARLEADVARLEAHPDYVETRNKVAAAREAQMKKLRALVADLRQRSVEEGIHHFVKRIDQEVDLADVFGHGPSAPGWKEPQR